MNTCQRLSFFSEIKQELNTTDSITSKILILIFMPFGLALARLFCLFGMKNETSRRASAGIIFLSLLIPAVFFLGKNLNDKEISSEKYSRVISMVSEMKGSQSIDEKMKKMVSDLMSDGKITNGEYVDILDFYYNSSRDALKHNLSEKIEHY